MLMCWHLFICFINDLLLFSSDKPTNKANQQQQMQQQQQQPQQQPQAQQQSPRGGMMSPLQQQQQQQHQQQIRKDPQKGIHVRIQQQQQQPTISQQLDKRYGGASPKMFESGNVIAANANNRRTLSNISSTSNNAAVTSNASYALSSDYASARQQQHIFDNNAITSTSNHHNVMNVSVESSTNALGPPNVTAPPSSSLLPPISGSNTIQLPTFSDSMGGLNPLLGVNNLPGGEGTMLPSISKVEVAIQHHKQPSQSSPSLVAPQDKQQEPDLHDIVIQTLLEVTRRYCFNLGAFIS